MIHQSRFQFGVVRISWTLAHETENLEFFFKRADV